MASQGGPVLLLRGCPPLQTGSLQKSDEIADILPGLGAYTRCHTHRWPRMFRHGDEHSVSELKAPPRRPSAPTPLSSLGARKRAMFVTHMKHIRRKQMAIIQAVAWPQRLPWSRSPRLPSSRVRGSASSEAITHTSTEGLKSPCVA